MSEWARNTPLQENVVAIIVNKRGGGGFKLFCVAQSYLLFSNVNAKQISFFPNERNLNLIKIGKLHLVSYRSWDTGCVWGVPCRGQAALYSRGIRDLCDEVEGFSLLLVFWWTFSSSESLSVCSDQDAKVRRYGITERALWGPGFIIITEKQARHSITNQ